MIAMTPARQWVIDMWHLGICLDSMDTWIEKRAIRLAGGHTSTKIEDQMIALNQARAISICSR